LAQSGGGLWESLREFSTVMLHVSVNESFTCAKPMGRCTQVGESTVDNEVEN